MSTRPARRRRAAGAALDAVGEFGLLAALLPTLPSGRGVRLGPGDDCAVLAAPRGAQLFTVDSLVEGVHFRRGWLTPDALGRRAFLINASDIAAMGGAPRWCVIDVGAPPRCAADDLAAISRGCAAAATAHGAALVGGNLSRAAQLSITVALIGAAPPRPLTRAGARPGDALYVSGRLGDAALGVRQLRRDAAARGAATARYRAPEPRLALGALLARRGIASAAIDVSDGLIQDLGHLCAASRVGARIEAARVPCTPAVRRTGLALHGGEDYELLFAVPPRRERLLARLAEQAGCALTRIGVCTANGEGISVVDARGVPLELPQAGHDHFRPAGATRWRRA